MSRVRSSSGLMGLAQYRAVWRLRGSPVLILGGIIGRLPIGMVPLALVLLIAQEYRSYTTAGISAGLFGVASAVAGPFLGRMADRWGPSPVLLVTAVVELVAVVVALTLILLHAPVILVWLACGACGAALPPLTAGLRSIWTYLTQDPHHALRQSALALETTVFEVVFVLGPLIVGVLIAIWSAAAAFAATGVLGLIGTVMVAFGQAARSWRPHPDRPSRVRGLGPAVAPGMPVLLLVVGGMAYAFGVIDVALPAFVAAHTSAEAANSVTGLLFALWAIGSVIGGVWFGSRRFAAPLPTQWMWTLTAVAIGLSVLVIVPNVPTMAIALLVGGLTLAPALTVENALVAQIAPPSMINEAYTWVSTVVFAVIAIGSALSGVVIDHAGGVRVAFILAAVAPILATIVAALPHSALRGIGRSG